MKEQNRKNSNLGVVVRTDKTLQFQEIMNILDPLVGSGKPSSLSRRRRRGKIIIGGRTAIKNPLKQR